MQRRPVGRPPGHPAGRPSTIDPLQVAIDARERQRVADVLGAGTSPRAPPLPLHRPLHPDCNGQSALDAETARSCDVARWISSTRRSNNLPHSFAGRPSRPAGNAEGAASAPAGLRIALAEDRSPAVSVAAAKRSWVRRLRLGHERKDDHGSREYNSGTSFALPGRSIRVRLRIQPFVLYELSGLPRRKLCRRRYLLRLRDAAAK